MPNISILLFMIFFHIIDDYCLQAFCLNTLKQKKFWQENAPEDMYKNDYIFALFMHGFSWSMAVHIPLFLTEIYPVLFAPSVIINSIIHGYIDNLKANKKKLNLIQDQLLHIGQILIIFIIYIIMKGSV